MVDTAQERRDAPSLAPFLSPAGAWALALGTSIGWGSFVITGNSFLLKAGPLGSVLGLLLGLGVMLLVAHNYHFLMQRYPSAGGVFAFATGVLGHDHAFLAAWFLGLTYAAMLWANATALPLFVRYVAGDYLQFGFSYRLFGYEVYLGEALLSVVAIVCVGLLCAKGKHGATALTLGLCTFFVIGITGCFVVAAAMHEPQFSYQPLFVAGTPKLSQVLRVACMTPWAFIGFESISHSAEEFDFPELKSFRILSTALVSAGALYVFVTLLSVTAYPEGYATWQDYIADLPSIVGFERYPAFFAARYYMGSIGFVILMISLLGLIVTSLVGNTVALSRLIFAVSREGLLPSAFCELNDEGVPERAIRAIVCISCLIPFMGRTAIGWIVDVTTLGATITYALVSFAAHRQAREEGDRTEMTIGFFAMCAMIALGLMLLLPSLIATGSMANESYFLFTMWAILGFLLFRVVLLKDKEQRYGKSVVVWIGLLSLVLFTSLAWMSGSLIANANALVGEVQGHYAAAGAGADDPVFLSSLSSSLSGTVSRDTALVAGLFVVSMSLMLSNFSIIQKRGEENMLQLGVARNIANTDPLTGVKSKHAYVAREAELNMFIERREAPPFAVVVCDVNGLKQVNDTLGHKAGDDYIRAASILICQLFKHSPVFRIGGDEFVVVMQGSDYEHRHELMKELDWQVVANQASGKVVVAAGMSEFNEELDREVASVFERADTLMYERKKELKAMPAE